MAIRMRKQKHFHDYREKRFTSKLSQELISEGIFEPIRHYLNPI